MNPSTKRILSTIAIIIASVAFGIVVSADLGSDSVNFLAAALGPA